MEKQGSQFQYFLRGDFKNKRWTVLRYTLNNGVPIESSEEKRDIPVSFDLDHIGGDVFNQLEFLFNATDEELELQILVNKMDDSKQFTVWRSGMFK